MDYNVLQPMHSDGCNDLPSLIERISGYEYK